MKQAERLEALEAHIASCPVCKVANKRANDFCDRGRLMFYDWIELEDPKSVVELDEEQLIRVIAQENERIRKAGSN
jgi:hypothetical protein